ncbi:MAG TPA: hypothetical protein VH415_15945 [Nitrososphaeraceae archaeon]
MQRNRPLGVTIVAILMIISGVISLVGGSLGLIGGIALSVLANDPEFGIFAAGLVAISSIIIALGIASLVVAWGLIRGKRWAWLVTIIIAIILIISSIAGIASGQLYSIVTLVIYFVIVYYTYRPEVKSYFGRQKLSI